MAPKQYFVTLKISSSILSQFPDLTNDPPQKHYKIKTKLKLKHKYEPNESSPLANPKAISSSVKSKLLEQEDTEGDIETKANTPETGTTTKRSLTINTKGRPTSNASANIPSSPIAQDLSSRGGTPAPSKQSLGTVNTASSGFTGNSLRVGGLTMNSNTVIELDKSGKPAKKWVRKTFDEGKLVRSFSGYNMHFSSWQLLESEDGTLEKEEGKTPIDGADINSNDDSVTVTGNDDYATPAGEVDSPLKQELTV